MKRPAGRANPTRPFIVENHVFSSFPYAKPINPHTGTNWEGTGVVPDHLLAREEDALAFVRTLIEPSTPPLPSRSSCHYPLSD